MRSQGVGNLNITKMAEGKSINIGGPLSAGIGAVGNLVSQLIGNRQEKRNQERQHEYNRELSETQYQRDLEMWNKANEYNSPLEQMDRLKKAGLNPNLVYGNGATATSSAQLPKYQSIGQSVSRMPPVDIPGMIGMFQDIQLKNAQIGATEAQAKLRWDEEKFAEDYFRHRRNLAFQKQEAGSLSFDKANQELALLRQKFDFNEKMNPLTLNYARTRPQQLTAQMERMRQLNAYTRQQVDYYSSNAIVGMFQKIMSGLGILKGR